MLIAITFAFGMLVCYASCYIAAQVDKHEQEMSEKTRRNEY